MAVSWSLTESFSGRSRTLFVSSSVVAGLWSSSVWSSNSGSGGVKGGAVCNVLGSPLFSCTRRSGLSVGGISVFAGFRRVLGRLGIVLCRILITELEFVDTDSKLRG